MVASKTMRSVAALLLWAAACAHPAACPGPPPITLGAPYLFEATSPEGTQVVLFGTYHVAGKDDVPRDAWRRLADAKTFVTELDDPDPAELDKLIHLPHDQNLESMLSADAWLDLRDALEGVVKPEQLARLRPFYALSLLTSVGERTASPSMDTALHTRAVGQGARVAALESWAEQLGALDRTVGVPDLLQALQDREHGRMRCEIAGALEAYRAGDDIVMARVLELAPDKSDDLIRARNLRWIDRLLEEAGRGGPLFVAVGVAHLLGPDSLPELMRARGFSVTRLPR
jgi:uncharacterized protein YbaP (TraB family)